MLSSFHDRRAAAREDARGDAAVAVVGGWWRRARTHCVAVVVDVILDRELDVDAELVEPRKHAVEVARRRRLGDRQREVLAERERLAASPRRAATRRARRRGAKARQ